MSEIKAIDTVYRGFKFRSRLEARWAFFFDLCGVEWEYELQGYETPAGRYLPDFYLHQYNVFAEIKPSSFDVEAPSRERRLLADVARGEMAGGVLFAGDPYDYETHAVWDEPYPDVTRRLREEHGNPLEFHFTTIMSAALRAIIGAPTYENLCDRYAHTDLDPFDAYLNEAMAFLLNQNFVYRNDGSFVRTRAIEKGKWGAGHRAVHVWMPFDMLGPPRYVMDRILRLEKINVLGLLKRLKEARSTHGQHARQARFEHGDAV